MAIAGQKKGSHSNLKMRVINRKTIVTGPAIHHANDRGEIDLINLSDSQCFPQRYGKYRKL